jgi:hypothetical protein
MNMLTRDELERRRRAIEGARLLFEKHIRGEGRRTPE